MPDNNDDDDTLRLLTPINKFLTILLPIPWMDNTVRDNNDNKRIY